METNPDNRLHLGAPVDLTRAVPRPKELSLATRYGLEGIPFVVQAPSLYGKTTFAKALLADWESNGSVAGKYLNLQTRTKISVLDWLHLVESSLAPGGADAVAGLQELDEAAPRKGLWKAQDRVLTLAKSLNSPTVVLVDEAEGLLGDPDNAQAWNNVLRTLSQSRSKLTFGLILRRHYSSLAGVRDLMKMSKFIVHDVAFGVASEEDLNGLYASAMQLARERCAGLDVALARRHCGRHPYLVEVMADCARGAVDGSTELGDVLLRYEGRAREFHEETLGFLASCPSADYDFHSGSSRHPVEVLAAVSSAWIASRTKDGAELAANTMKSVGRAPESLSLLRNLGLVEGRGDQCRPYAPGFALLVVVTASKALGPRNLPSAVEEPQQKKTEISAVRKVLGVSDVKEVVAFAAQAIAVAKSYAEYLTLIGL